MSKRRIDHVCLIVLVFSFVLFSMPNQSKAYKLPDTGQTKCYQGVSPYAEIPCAGTGQDGEHIINPKSYTDNGNGTVTDNNTELMWQKCTAGQNNDGTCSGQATGYTWADAVTYCTNLRTGGYTDWRLPTKKEIITLVDYSKNYPLSTINQTYFPGTISDIYWTATNDSNNTNIAWTANFAMGYFLNSFYKPDQNLYVRCVRGGQSGSNFTDNANGTVTETKTGLMWQKCSAGQNNDASCSGNTTKYKWQDALNYCNNLTLGGYTDWRLPSIVELESITDDTRSNPASYLTYFPNTQLSAYWSSTTNNMYTTSAWFVDFEYGRVHYENKINYPYDLRCVRGGQSGTCIYTINPTTATFTSLSGAGVVRVNVSPSGCAESWTSVSNASWIAITSGANGSGNGSVAYTVSQNTTGSARTGTITVAGKTHTVTQTASTRDPIYRFYNTHTGGHFFTDNPDERNMVIRDLPDFNWEIDGAFYIFRTQQAGTSPVYRLFNTYGVGHYYTISESDKDAKIAQGYALERVGFYAYTTQVSGTKPVYYFNRPAHTNNGKEAWFYTISEAEKDLIITTMPVWVYQGVAFYAYE